MKQFRPFVLKRRWEILDTENKANKQTKEQGVDYTLKVLPNRNTYRPLPIGNRYLLFKPEERWRDAQSPKKDTVHTCDIPTLC
ncbi:hypothetical protein [Carboxylicivirga taeanensis]|uniref:hypothetical protein n=1 Tax=Carboxylicivirga taeanensis TaxID=1416875 RepID=UPI003F6E1785